MAQLAVAGIIWGSLYALVGVRWGLIYGTTRTFHFAHGIRFTLTAYGGSSLTDFSICRFFITQKMKEKPT